MIYGVEISSVASAEADRIALTIATILGAERAQQWYAGLLIAIESLSQMPTRCSLARENEFFSQDVRQLLYGRGRSVYRIIFTIVGDPDRLTVRILRIRHVSQSTIGEEPEDV
jgi:plasmid stabilization system protein ParE